MLVGCWAFDESHGPLVQRLHDRREAVHALGSGTVRQLLEQQRAKPTALPVVSHGDRDFCALGVVPPADVARHAHPSTGDGVDRDDGLVVVVVDIGQILDCPRVQFVDGREEPAVARVGAEPLERRRQCRFVVRSDLANRDRGAIAKTEVAHGADTAKPRAMANMIASLSPGAHEEVEAVSLNLA